MQLIVDAGRGVATSRATTSTTSSVTLPEQDPAELATCVSDAQTLSEALDALMAAHGAYPSPPAAWSAATYATNYRHSRRPRRVAPSCPALPQRGSTSLSTTRPATYWYAPPGAYGPYNKRARTSPWFRISATQQWASPNTVQLSHKGVVWRCASRWLAEASSDRRLSDLVSVGVLTRTFPPTLVDEVVADCGRTEQRNRALPARAMAYFSIGMALHSQGSYEDVLALLTDGLAWTSGEEPVVLPSKSAVFQARARSGTRAPPGVVHSGGCAIGGAGDAGGLVGRTTTDGHRRDLSRRGRHA